MTNPKILRAIFFYWGGDSELSLHDRSYEDALKFAKEFGYCEPCWYKPWTWKNGVVIVE